jgi:hypothetical protein
MSIGSFLATAGRIGEGVEQYRTNSAVRRLQEQQAIAAQDALAREAAVRRDLKMLPQLDPLSMPQLGAPILMEQISAPEPTSAEITPPPASITAPPPPPSAAPTPGWVRYNALKIDGVDVQPWNTSRPDRLDTAGVGGFERVDPNASSAAQLLTTTRNNNALRFILSEISKKNYSLIGGVTKYFVPQDQKRAMEAQQAASNWYNTNDAMDYFRRNPEMLAVAQKKPVVFFNALNQTNQRVTEARSRRAPAGVREEPAFLAESRNLPAWQQIMQGAESGPTQQTEQVGVAPPPAGTSGSFANIPFAQVKQRIVGREGPAALGGYSALAYNTPDGRNAAGVPQPPKPLTSMTIKEVLDFQRGPMRAATKGYRNRTGQWTKPDPGSTGVGAYQFESRTLAENAKLALGEAWMNAPFTPQNQDRIAETLYNRVRGNQAQLASTWAVFSGGGTTQEIATSAAPVPQLKNSDFYLAKEGAIGSDLALALRNRQEIARIATIYQQNGMVDQFLNLRFKLMETDSNLLYLQGMQGIQEISALRDPRRLESVYSAYLGSPVQFQPRSDGKFNVVVGGKVVQSGMDTSDLVTAVRTGIDAQYRTDRTKLSSEISMENFKSELRRQETAEEKILEAAASIQKALIDGKVQLAKTIAENAGGKITAQGDNVYLQKDGLLYKIDPGGEQVPGAAAGLVTQPSARLVPVGASG